MAVVTALSRRSHSAQHERPFALGGTVGPNLGCGLGAPSRRRHERLREFALSCSWLAKINEVHAARNFLTTGFRIRDYSREMRPAL